MRLSEDRFYRRYPCILITAKGQPDVATRMFLRMLKMQLKIPVLGLVDSDPYGRHCCHCFAVALLRCCTASLLHCFAVALLRCCTASLLHCFAVATASLLHCFAVATVALLRYCTMAPSYAVFTACCGGQLACEHRAPLALVEHSSPCCVCLSTVAPVMSASQQ
jgi:hypothetical protein